MPHILQLLIPSNIVAQHVITSGGLESDLIVIMFSNRSCTYFFTLHSRLKIPKHLFSVSMQTV